MVEHIGTSGVRLLLEIPTVEQIADAVADIPHRMRPRPWLAGPRRFLTVTAGAVRISTKFGPGADKGSSFSVPAARNRAVSYLEAERDAVYRPMVFVDTEEAAHVPEALIEPEFTLPYAPVPKRGKITDWSRKSRARAEFTLQSLDWSPLFDEAGGLPGMLTVTMPGRYWEDCTPDPASFKKKIADFQRAYKVAWGVMPAGAWKMEFQRRGAPHVHMLTTPPAGLSAGREHAKDSGGKLVWTDSGEVVSLNTGGLFFMAWVSLTWAKIVGVHKTDHKDAGQAFIDHVKAGTRIDRSDIDRYLDPRRIARYFIKHGAFASKEYQNEMPQLWLDAIAAGGRSGTFWGYWQLQKTDATVELKTCSDSSWPLVVGLDRTGIIGHSWQAEEGASWSTDATVLRAWARDQGTATDDATKVERHLKRLSRSKAANRGFKRKSVNSAGDLQEYFPVVQKTKYACRCGVGKYGVGPHRAVCRAQLVTDSRVRVIRYDTTAPAVDFDQVNTVTGEVESVQRDESIRRVRSYRVGYYTGGNGFLSVNDGRATARDVARILGGSPQDRQRDYVLVS